MPRLRLIAANSNPAQLVVIGFVSFIAIGTALLWLPLASDGRTQIGFENALFMSTSASTVTGLATVPIDDFSLFGELVILALIQIGGFGIMTIGSLLALIASNRVGLRQRMVAQAEIGAVDVGELRTLIAAIARITLGVEGILALILFVRFWHGGYEDSPGRAAYSAIFHSVSSFNNAGISLYTDSLARFANDPVVVLSISGAFIIGGIGFPILVEMWRHEQHRRNTGSKRVIPWSLHTKITLWATAGLLVIGPAVVLAFEWTNPATLGPLDLGDKFLAGWFQGVTPRTAGFSTLNFGGMNEPTLLVVSVLMFIGAGPASTSGGIKVTTVAVLTLVLWSEVRGNIDVTAFWRRLPEKLIRQALAIVMLALVVVIGTTLTLMGLDDLSLTSALFEAASAFGTVGLSTGITAGLSGSAQLLLVFVMLAGRVGPMTLVTAWALRDHVRVYRYPEERPIIG